MAAKTITLSRDELKAALTSAGIEFSARLGDKKLIALCEANEIGTTKTLVSNSIVPPKYKKIYGAKAHCGDELASVLKEFVTNADGNCDPKQLLRVMRQNDIDADRWSGLNIGQQRMNLGNVLRARVKNSKAVFIGDETFGTPEPAPKKARAPRKPKVVALPAPAAETGAPAAETGAMPESDAATTLAA